MAATLAIAKFLSQYKGKFSHTVKFCFFNAEEMGLIGSNAYASFLKDKDIPLRAIMCMDMIGYNNDINRLFEIHAGFTDPAYKRQFCCNCQCDK